MTIDVRGSRADFASESPLKDRVALVSGTSGRLGPVWTAALEAAGATVVGLDLRSDRPPGVVDSEQVDIADPAVVMAAYAALEERHGTPDVFVHSAGIDAPPGSTGGGLESVLPTDFARVVEINLTAAFTLLQLVGGAMARAGRGSIVVVGSLYASQTPDPGMYSHFEPAFLKPPAYAASKAGLVHLTRYLARLLGPSGVRANVLSPGGIAAGQDAEFVRKFSARVALQRMGAPEDLTGPLIFLASDASRYVTGQELRVDGGFTA